jgi:hypothetical protein
VRWNRSRSAVFLEKNGHEVYDSHYTYRRFSLAPVAFCPDPPSTLVDPATFNPAGMGVGRCDVGAGNPNIVFAVPAVIAGVPGPVTMLGWRRRNDFVRVRRRANSDDDLSLSHARSKEQGAG